MKKEKIRILQEKFNEELFDLVIGHQKALKNIGRIETPREISVLTCTVLIQTSLKIARIGSAIQLIMDGKMTMEEAEQADTDPVITEDCRYLLDQILKTVLSLDADTDCPIISIEEYRKHKNKGKPVNVVEGKYADILRLLGCKDVESNCGLCPKNECYRYLLNSYLIKRRSERLKKIGQILQEKTKSHLALIKAEKKKL